MPYLIPFPEPPLVVEMGQVNQLSAPAIVSGSEPFSLPGEKARSQPFQSVSKQRSGVSQDPVSLSDLSNANTVAELPQTLLPATNLSGPTPPGSFTLSPALATTANDDPLRAVTPLPVSSQPSTLPPALPAAALAQSASPDEEASPETAPEPSPESETVEEPAVVYPRAATPEPFWSNGAITGSGQLLPPSLPTNRPAVPLDLTADYQEYEPLQQVVTASGSVILKLGNSVLAADRLWANLFNRYVLVEGNVVFQQGRQTIRGQRGEYNLLQGQGTIFDANGTLFLPAIDDDFASILPDTVTPNTRPVSELLPDERPLGDVRTTGGVTFGTGVGADLTTLPAATDAGGSVRRIRFEAAQVDFDAEGWIAREIRLTNDPFSPPELEIRGDTATLVRINETEDELFIENPRLVFDQAFSVPLFRSRFTFQRGGTDDANPFLVGFGIDGDDRDGLFIERPLPVVATPLWQVQVTPQVLVQRLFNNQDVGSLDNLGLEVDVDGRLGPTTQVSANTSFSGLDFDNLEDRLRASVRVQQALGTHSLNLEYSYRDRLFNGSLGFQSVQSSIGAVLLSPNIVLGDTGIVLSYQASAQYVTAETDQPDLLDPFEFEDLVSLGRFQGSVALSRGFTLWQGEPLPPTRDEGLRFTPRPVVPNLQLVLSGRGTYTYYTSQDTQSILSTSVGIRGEFGHFSRDFFDSTIFNLGYRRAFLGEGESPFKFDRDVDQNVLSGGLIQQIYGPFRIGFQTSYNLDTNEFINTNYVLEYSRRTYGIVFRYNPIQASGFIGFRLSDFDWSGRAARFGGADINQVEGGIVR
ncbi:MAG: DUF3769 domain-containing protein [Leptolyngbya sp. SIO1E4]|nr:DUF3769 domain-containing protein [Leptolyngbya sp. SIO1E4]